METTFTDKARRLLNEQIRQARISGEKVVAFHVPRSLVHVAHLTVGGYGKILQMDWSASDDLVQFWIVFP